MLPPTIPTSFVPHSASTASRRFHIDFTNTFSFISYIILCIVFVLAIGVFLYGQFLSANRASKDAVLAQAEASINPATVEGFMRLRDRLASGKILLESHTAFSTFFAELGTFMPSAIRFTLLHISVDDQGAIKLEGSGVAQNFNTLASASLSFGQNGHIKDAIFSNIAVNPKDNSVSFTLVATLDPKLVAFSP